MILTVPRDVVYIFLGYLDLQSLARSSAVCTVFQRWTNHELLWRRHALENPSPLLPERGFKQACINQTLRDYLVAHNDINTQAINQLAKRFWNATELDLRFCTGNLTPSMIMTIANRFEGLQTLRLRFWNNGSPKGIGLALLILVRKHPLKELALEQCSSISGEAIVNLARACPGQWTNLSLSRHTLANQQIQEIVQLQTRMERFTLLLKRGIKNATVQTLVQACQSLGMLHLTGCTRIDQKALKAFYHHPTKLVVKIDCPKRRLGHLRTFIAAHQKALVNLQITQRKSSS